MHENGVLKLAYPLPLKELQQVQVTVHTETSPLMRAYGIMAWAGDSETVEHVASAR